jgi:hypothetical protein
MKFKKGYELPVTHSLYGDGKILETFKVNGEWWCKVRVNDHLVVETPKVEWKLKNSGQ